MVAFYDAAVLCPCLLAELEIFEVFPFSVSGIEWPSLAV